jgi:hypothetical protein
MDQPRLYLVLLSHREDALADAAQAWMRTFAGEFTHCELAFELEGALVRAVVPATGELYVFRTPAPFDPARNWVYLCVPCSAEQLRAVNAAVVERVRRRDYFSERLMYRSGLPDVPGWAERWLFAPAPAAPPAAGEATYCAKLCLEALQAAGMLPGLRPARVTSGDLFAHLQRELGAYVEEAAVAHTQDSAGYPLSFAQGFREAFRLV